MIATLPSPRAAAVAATLRRLGGVGDFVLLTSYEQLARLSRYSVRSVQDALVELAHLGAVEVTQQWRQPTITVAAVASRLDEILDSTLPDQP